MVFKLLSLCHWSGTRVTFIIFSKNRDLQLCGISHLSASVSKYNKQTLQKSAIRSVS